MCVHQLRGLYIHVHVHVPAWQAAMLFTDSTYTQMLRKNNYKQLTASAVLSSVHNTSLDPVLHHTVTWRLNRLKFYSSIACVVSDQSKCWILLMTVTCHICWQMHHWEKKSDTHDTTQRRVQHHIVNQALVKGFQRLGNAYPALWALLQTFETAANRMHKHIHSHSRIPTCGPTHTNLWSTTSSDLKYMYCTMWKQKSGELTKTIYFSPSFHPLEKYGLACKTNVNVHMYMYMYLMHLLCSVYNCNYTCMCNTGCTPCTVFNVFYCCWCVMC